VTEEFERWWEGLNDDERVSIDGMIRVLEVHGPSLGPPYSVQVATSRHPDLRQLRVPHQERDICVLFVSSDLHSTLVLLLGSAASDRAELCPAEVIERADGIYSRYLGRLGEPG